MVWRREHLPSTMTSREFHGVLQVAMGWDSIHLYQVYRSHDLLRLMGADRRISRHSAQ
ncbi:IS1096 element passenger TnpR family protein [Mesorhizobium australicum]|uniref:IS1096 element passenger TnpR family protein n=1 Tax=Mesorhizobium australicum TaxID=536018 RepID=UPI00333D586A